MEIYNGYEYNDCGVCMNPDVPYEFGKWSSYHFRITVSETPNGWIYGYFWGSNTRGGCVGSLFNANITYPSKSEAIVACAERVKECYIGDKGSHKIIVELDRIIAEESGKKPQAKQLTIFDYL